MSRSIYLASKFRRCEEMAEYADELRELGYEVTSRWITQHGGPGLSLDDPRFPQFALDDVEDVRRADTLISFTAGGGGRGGRHAEFGMGVAFGKRLILVGPVEHVFHTLPQVERVDLWGEAKERLLIARSLT